MTYYDKTVLEQEAKKVIYYINWNRDEIASKGKLLEENQKGYFEIIATLQELNIAIDSVKYSPLRNSEWRLKDYLWYMAYHLNTLQLLLARQDIQAMLDKWDNIFAYQAIDNARSILAMYPEWNGRTF